MTPKEKMETWVYSQIGDMPSLLFEIISVRERGRYSGIAVM